MRIRIVTEGAFATLANYSRNTASRSSLGVA